MPSLLQVGAVIVSGALLLLVIDLVRRRKLTEEYSFIWILCAVALLVLSLWRDILHVTARWIGVYYPPAVLLLVLMVSVFMASLYFSVVISGQRRQIERLVEEIALLDQRLREAERDDEPAADRGFGARDSESENRDSGTPAD
jgi:hypothetical protein